MYTKWTAASIHFICSRESLFLERHSNILSIRRPCGTSFARALGFNKENVDKFFQMLEAEYDKFHYTPDRIYNVDETGVTVMQNKVVDVISRKGKRQIASMTAAERGSLITDDLDIPTGRPNPDDDDCSCLFCDGRFSEDSRGNYGSSVSFVINGHIVNVRIQKQTHMYVIFANRLTIY
ncbi:hypothetical protein ANN_01226 [Periplaneta americana]|uniref:Transposase n=1 Tax=Periplaneta americana TaxID=6978 RepID=A0ABQ8TX14_PERAM|nr:hypothetical protein ANN_01226 [Periplaneta americana]